MAKMSKEQAEKILKSLGIDPKTGDPVEQPVERPSRQSEKRMVAAGASGPKILFEQIRRGIINGLNEIYGEDNVRFMLKASDFKAPQDYRRWLGKDASPNDVLAWINESTPMEALNGYHDAEHENRIVEMLTAVADGTGTEWEMKDHVTVVFMKRTSTGRTQRIPPRGGTRAPIPTYKLDEVPEDLRPLFGRTPQAKRNPCGPMRRNPMDMDLLGQFHVGQRVKVAGPTVGMETPWGTITELGMHDIAGRLHPSARVKWDRPHLEHREWNALVGLTRPSFCPCGCGYKLPAR